MSQTTTMKEHIELRETQVKKLCAQVKLTSCIIVRTHAQCISVIFVAEEIHIQEPYTTVICKNKQQLLISDFFYFIFFSSVGFYKALVCILGYCPDQPTETYGYGGFYVVCACVKTKNNGLFYQYSSILRIYIHCQWTSDNYGHVFISF